MDQRHPGGRKDYFSYLLRLWRASQEDGPIWRASLRRPGTEEALGFASLEALFSFLRAETGAGEVEEE
jgi:hypothetical protein